MKGAVVKAVEKLVISKTSVETWENILVEAGFKKERLFLIRDNVDDSLTIKLITITARTLGVELLELFDIFGDYWINTFTSNIYAPFYENIKTGKEFLLELDTIHVSITEMMNDATPPRFDYEEIDDNTLIVTYKSERGLIELFMSIARALFVKYQEKVKIEKIDEQKVKFIWL